jgi:hypothetical protein
MVFFHVLVVPFGFGCHGFGVSVCGLVFGVSAIFSMGENVIVKLRVAITAHFTSASELSAK